jgi:CHAT domain-containing protein
MKGKTPFSRNAADRCLTTDEFWRYAARASPDMDLDEMELHLARCSSCREELACLIKLLHPEGRDAFDLFPEPSEAEIVESYKIVQQVEARERISASRANAWSRRGTAAAAAAILLIVGTSGLKYLSDKKKSERFLSAGIETLESAYPASSPHGMRLDLPFQPAATRRGDPGEDALDRSENLFYQALAVRSGLLEAHLGLGAVYLGKSQFAKARSEFENVLQARSSHPQAMLGRGVACYEEALRAKDPVGRESLIKQALADFDAVLRQNSRSLEARYNRIWLFFDAGRHKEALEEIRSYLEQDPSSIWAARLRDLKARIELSRPDAVEEAVHEAAAVRESARLESLVRLLPNRIPAAIQHALRLSLELEGSPSSTGNASSEDFRWAAETMASSYAAATGDRGYVRLLDYCNGLPATLRQKKRSLDARFKKLMDLYRVGEIDSVLPDTKYLAHEYEIIGDSWQLLNVDHLRGSCFYYLARFEKAEAEYRRMLALAEQIGSPDLIARSLAALGSTLNEQRRLEEDLDCNAKLSVLAETHGMDYWMAYASRNLGNIHLLLDRLGESTEAYLAALRPAYQLRDEGLLVNTLENLGLALDRSGRLSEARSFYDLALKEQQRFSEGDSAQDKTAAKTRSLNLLYKYAELSLRMGDLNAAEEYFSRSLEGAQDGMRELECRDRLGLAEVCFKKGKLNDAGTLVSASLELAESNGFTDLLWQAYFLRGRLLERMGNPQAAIGALGMATEAVERLSGEVPTGELRQSFVKRKLDPYREIVSLLLRSPDQLERAWQYADQAKSMVLRDYLASQRIRPNSAQPPFRQASSRVLPPAYALLEYFFVSDKLIVFRSSHNFSDAVVLNVPLSLASEQVDHYLEGINNHDEDTFRKLSLELNQELIAPALDRLKPESIETLIICPDGPLHLLPFAGLKDGQGKYLLEQHALAYASSRGIFEHCLSLNRGDAGTRDRSILLLDGSSNLQGAEGELAFLSGLYGRNAAFLDIGASAPAKRRAGHADILHFAGHSLLFAGKPALAVRIGRDQVYLSAAQIGSWNLGMNRLVNLSGCNTGTGPPAEGEMPWGLIPAFLNAGVPALLVSLMPVEDRATQELNAHFYSLLAAGSTSKAKALQKAQLTLMAEMRTRGVFDPISWMPFVLVGDPR